VPRLCNVVQSNEFYRSFDYDYDYEHEELQFDAACGSNYNRPLASEFILVDQ
jgi:hypothetical protein